jgi:hypothetical protein
MTVPRFSMSSPSLNWKKLLFCKAPQNKVNRIKEIFNADSLMPTVSLEEKIRPQRKTFEIYWYLLILKLKIIIS